MGERRQATIVFSDLSGYTAMNEKLDPEEVEEIMGRIKGEAVALVERHGGIVNQFVGDEVLALFGIPFAHEDDPLRAAKATLEIHSVVRRISDSVEDRIGRPLRMHSGINTGLVVTNLRDEREGRYGITGDTVNTGARLADHAKTDEILISPETQREIGRFFVTESLEAVELKGKAQPIVPYRIVGKTNVQTRFEAAKRQGLTAFTGRDRELETLFSRFEDTCVGKGQFISVVGEAGLGKSRLFHEFRHTIDLERVWMLIGRCQPSEENSPYLPYIEAFRRGMKLQEEDSPSVKLEKVTSQFRAFDPDMERLIPFLLKLLSIPSEKYVLGKEMHGEALRRAFDEAFTAFVNGLTRERPLVMLFEDWQWADEGSDLTMRKLAEWGRDLPLLVMVNYRPDYKPKWGQLDHQTQITLPAFTAQESEALVRSALGARQLPVGLAALIGERTGGNPFFIEEVCHTLKEDGTVRVRKGEAILTHTLEEVSLPQSVRAVVQTRVDRLDQLDREILGVASVIGRQFAKGVLERVAAAGAGVIRSLERLQAQDLILQIRTEPEPEYAFKQLLTQVVTYETLLHQQRRKMHGRVGEAIESLHEDQLEEHYEALARHFLASRDSDKAIRYLKLAAEKAALYHSLPQARLWYREAIAILDGRDGSADAKRERIDLSLRLAEISHYETAGNHREILEASLKLAREVGDKGRFTKATYWNARFLAYHGNQLLALDQLEKCLKMAEAARDEEIVALVHSTMGRIFVLTSQFGKGSSHLEKGFRMTERLGRLDEACYSLTFSAILQCWTGDFDLGFSTMEKSLAMAHSTGNLSREGVTYTDYALVQCLRGDWSAASGTLERCFEISRQTGNDIWVLDATWIKAWITFMLGERTEGLATLRKMATERGQVSFGGLIGAALLECCALAGELSGMDEIARKISKISRLGETWADPMKNRALALAAAQADAPDWDKAEGHMAESLRLAEQKGARPDSSISHLRYAEILHKKGDSDAAGEQLDEATTLFKDMRMTWWNEQAEGLRARIDRG